MVGIVGIYKKIYAVIFILMLFGFAITDYILAGSSVVTDVKAKLPEDTSTMTAESINAFPKEIDTILTNDLVGKHMWNEVYGTVFAALGKNEENNFTYVRDKNGQMYLGNFWNTTDIEPIEMARRIRRMQDDLAGNGTKVIMLLYPTKSDKAWLDGYYGIPYPDLNDTADELLVYLRRYNVDYIDYREILKETKKSGKELFFAEDSHWRIETAFYVTTKLVEHLKELGEDRIDPDGFYCDLENNYITETYSDYCLGSQGREAGEVYAGRDTFTFIYPKYKTEFRWKYMTSAGEDKKLEGDIENTLIRKKVMELKDLYEKDMYSCYMGGVEVRDSVVNNLSNNEIKVLFIRNSYSTPVVTFFAPMVRETHAVWTDTASEELTMAAIKSNIYDYVFVALNEDAFFEKDLSFYTKPLEGEETE